MPIIVAPPLPTNLSTSTTRLLMVDPEGAVQVRDLGPDVCAEPVEWAVPVRRFYAWPGKRNYDGLWWSSTIQTHLGFESLLERQALMVSDFDPAVVAISVQPFALLWPHPTRRPRHHVPDLFLRLADGGGGVVGRLTRRPDR